MNSMKSLKYIICTLALGCAVTSCQDIFEPDSDRQIFDPALDQKTDSMFYTLGILKGLQQVADQYVMQGEMRGDLTATNSSTETHLRRLADFTADATNRYDSAYLYYRIINNCNYYVAHRDTTLLTGSSKVAIPEYVEALAVRAWAYLQLAKQYGRVPFYTHPLVNIGDAERVTDTKDLQGIADALIPQLARYSGTPVPSYGNISAGVLNSSDSDNPVEKTVVSARAMIPVDLILADLYLETHRYEQAARYYFAYLSDRKLQAQQAYINPQNYSSVLGDKLPSSYTMSLSNAFNWTSMFSTNSTNDIITYIPMAANRLRGEVTELPRYFGYDFYSTTGGTASSTVRYLVERQIDASAPYIALSDAQEYYFVPSGQTGVEEIRIAEIGDLRRLATMKSVARTDTAFAVMVKFNNANIPLYRTATVYLRLAEALNRMGYPDAAFAILKDGINDNLLTHNDYLRPETEQLLKTTVPFLSKGNVEKFTSNKGIHSRGVYACFGQTSPYQMETVVGRKLQELVDTYGIPLQGTLNDTINAMEDLICDEMALELAFEGNRFGDLTRMAEHKNHAGLYGANYGIRWLARKLAYKADGLEQRLMDKQNWYLPFK